MVLPDIARVGHSFDRPTSTHLPPIAPQCIAKASTDAENGQSCAFERDGKRFGIEAGQGPPARGACKPTEPPYKEDHGVEHA
jgi:hypothetical protein